MGYKEKSIQTLVKNSLIRGLLSIFKCMKYSYLLIFIISFSTYPIFSQCPVTISPDLPLTVSNATINSDITTIFNRFSTDYLGNSIPSLTIANSTYSGLNIGLPGEQSISNWNSQNWSFLKTYVEY